MAFQRDDRQCAGALRHVRGAGGTGGESPSGLYFRRLHPVGRDLHHDGYPLLVHDSGLCQGQQGTGGPFHPGKDMCGHRQRAGDGDHHAGGVSPGKGERKDRVQMVRADCGGLLCLYGSTDVPVHQGEIHSGHAGKFHRGHVPGADPQ